MAKSRVTHCSDSRTSRPRRSERVCRELARERKRIERTRKCIEEPAAGPQFAEDGPSVDLAETSPPPNIHEFEAHATRPALGAQINEARAQHAEQRLREKLSIARDYQKRPKSVHNSGSMDHLCSRCGAAHFEEEKPRREICLTLCAVRKTRLNYLFSSRFRLFSGLFTLAMMKIQRLFGEASAIRNP
jgi:hypothetical protein